MNFETCCVKIVVNGCESTGFLFNDVGNISSLVLTSKHSICLERGACEKIKLDKANCRVCVAKHSFKNTAISGKSLSFTPIKIHCSKKTDVALVEVEKIDNAPKLYLTRTGKFEDFNVLSCYGVSRHALSIPLEIAEGFTKYNIKSNAVANLQDKKTEFRGFSGALIFNQAVDKIIAEAILTDDERCNDIGAEKLNFDLIQELNSFVNTDLFEICDEIVSDSRRIIKLRSAPWNGQVKMDIFSSGHSRFVD